MKKLFSILMIAMVLTLSAGTASASSYATLQDTYLYQFLGNQGGGDGDSGGILVWNHESIHGGQALIQFDPNWMSDAALSGAYQATLNLYSYCSMSGFVGGCPGDSGAESTTTDVVIQRSAWSEADGTIGWEDLDNTGTSVSFTQTGTGGWISIDITPLIQTILESGVDYGFVLSQEAYPVIRNEEGSIAVSAFCDSELNNNFCSETNFAPYLEIRAVPLPGALWLLLAALSSLGLVRNDASRPV